MSGANTKLAVIGWPIDHSLSPAIHNHWIDAYGITATYEKIPVPPEHLTQFIASAGAKGFRGFNITLPHKTEAMHLIGNIDDIATRIGAINTVTIDDDGVLSATNTDAAGFMADLRALAPNWQSDAGPVLVLGAGGAARAVVVALLDAGVSEVRISNRTAERVDRLIDDLGGVDADNLSFVQWPDKEDRAQDVTLLVNATSQGLAGGSPLEFDVNSLNDDTIVYDLIYGTEDTPLVLNARARGLPAHGGLGMLCRQAALSFQQWIGILPEVTEDLVSSLRRQIETARH